MKSGLIVWLGGFICVFLIADYFQGCVFMGLLLYPVYTHLYQSASSWWHLAKVAKCLVTLVIGGVLVP